MRKKDSRFVITLLGCMVLVISIITVSIMSDLKREEEFTNICNEQGLTALEIKQYGRASIWLCVNEDGVLRVPKKKEF